MASHRHWGLGVYAKSGSGNGASIAEVEMRATPAGADLCSGGTASGASTGGQVAANAFDNSNATQWYNGATGGLAVFLNYDFGSPVDVVEIWIRLASAGTHNGTTFGPGVCFVRYSDDGTNWKVGSRAFDATSLRNDETLTVGSISDAPPTARLSGGPVGSAVGFTPTWPASPRVFDGKATLVRRYEFGGLGKIEGTLKIKGTPNYAVRREVCLIRERDMVCVAAQWSDPITGAYSFLGFDPVERYTVVAYDYTNAFRAVVGDNILPEAM